MQDVEGILPLQYPSETLYDGFLRNVKLNPDRVAIIDSETKEEITYHKLYEISLKVADCLGKNGVKKGDYVGITLPRGSRQLYAIFGILFTGAAYVSIGIAQPNDRRTKIYDQIGIKCIISDEKTVIDCKLNKNEVKIIDLDVAMANVAKLKQPVEISPYDSAYIIMTSGTTGVPKGVEIMHTSAVNTCIDLNEKYNVNAEDTILMVSAIDFDLSFMIFWNTSCWTERLYNK
nr:AMP-binding protein [Streptococcus equi]